MKKWDYIELKSFSMAKEIISKMKRPPIKWEEVLQAIYEKRYQNYIYNICNSISKTQTS